MIETLIYTTLMFFLTFVYFKYNFAILGFILQLYYSLVSLFALMVIYQNNMVLNETAIFGYLFLVLNYIIVFLPFLYARTKKFNPSKIIIRDNKLYRWMLYLYLACSLVAMYCYMPKVFELITTGEWKANLQDLYNQNMIKPYSSIVENIALVVCSYMSLPILIIGFSVLSYSANPYKRKSYILGMVAAILTSFLSAMYISSRGIVVENILLFTGLYIFFYPKLDNRIKHSFNYICSVLVVFFSIYLATVTISRFDSIGISNSIISYFGQSPIIFSNIIFPVEEHYFGKFSLGILFGNEIFNSWWGTGFYTFVGWLFIDWGIFGTLLLTITCSYVTHRFINKNKYQLCDLYIIFSVYNFLLRGVFVIGRTEIYRILMTLFIYFMFKFAIQKRSVLKLK